MNTPFSEFFITQEPLKILRWNFSSFIKISGLFLGQKLHLTVGSLHAKIINSEFFKDFLDQFFEKNIS